MDLNPYAAEQMVARLGALLIQLGTARAHPGAAPAEASHSYAR